jgi:membrane protein implicated in regulation of membrane protease activity
MTVMARKTNSFSMKKIPKIVWDEFIYGGYFVVLGDISAIVAFSLILKLDVSISFFIVVATSVFSVNLFNRYEETLQGNSIRCRSSICR